MDQRTPSDMRREAVMSAFEIVSEFTLARRTLPPSDPANDRFERFANALEAKGKAVSLTLFALTIFEFGCGALGYFLDSRLFMKISSIGIVICLLLWLTYMLAVTITQIPSVIKIVRAPFKPFLRLVKYALEVEQPYINRLADIDVVAVKHVLAHYKNERNAMEKRGYSLSGAIDKVGLFPALGGVALLYLGLKAFSTGSEWVQMLVPVIASFHLMNFLALDLYAKFDRIIVMLEHSIATRN
jgi:hypothetical protein